MLRTVILGFCTLQRGICHRIIYITPGLLMESQYTGKSSFLKTGISVIYREESFFFFFLSQEVRPFLQALVKLHSF